MSEWTSANLRPVWSTQGVLGQPGLQSKTLSQNKFSDAKWFHACNPSIWRAKVDKAQSLKSNKLKQKIDYNQTKNKEKKI